MDASAGAAPNGIRILVLGADLAAVEPVVESLESWGAFPLVLFDVPSALNALTRARPYLVVLDSRFGADLGGVLAALRGDRTLPADARRPVPTLVLSGPNDPPLSDVIGPELASRVSTVPRDQPLAVESALREALQLAGLSSYAPLAFGPPGPAAAVGPRITPPVPTTSPAPTAVSARAPAGASAAAGRAPFFRPLLVAAALLALLAVFAIPGYFVATGRLRGPGAGRPEAQPAGARTATPAQPGQANPPSPTGAAASAQPTQSGQPAPAGQPAPQPGLLDPLAGLLGPLLGIPPAAQAPPAPATGATGQSGQPGIGQVSPSGSSGTGLPSTIRPPWQPPQVPRLSFCGDVERWRPIVRETLADAWSEGRLDGPAFALDDDLVLALILRESTGDPRALGTGGEGEIGLLQLLPGTFGEQLNRTAEPAASLIAAMQDPRLNLRAGVRYLSRAFTSQDGDLYWSLVAYRAGVEGASAYRRAGGTPIDIDARVRATLETYARHRPDVRLVYVPSPGSPAPAAIKPVLPAGAC